MKKYKKTIKLSNSSGIRSVWTIKPITRVKESKKRYTRKGKENYDVD